jgi:hypothetical protein
MAVGADHRAMAGVFVRIVALKTLLSLYGGPQIERKEKHRCEGGAEGRGFLYAENHKAH